MDIRYFELRAANKDCKEKFSDVAKKKYGKSSIMRTKNQETLHFSRA